MTAAVQQIVNSFEALSEADKHEAAAEILRRSYAEGEISEQTLVELADELFCALDREEEVADAGR